MKCSFDYCIYNNASQCLLSEIEINPLGQCEECIIVSLPKYKLEKYKKNHLQEIIEECGIFE